MNRKFSLSNKQKGDAILSDALDSVPANVADVKSQANENDLLLYVLNAKKRTKSPSAVGRITKLQHQHDETSLPSSSFSTQIEFNQNDGDQRNLQSVMEKPTQKESSLVTPLSKIMPIDTHQLNEGLKYENSPTQFGRNVIEPKSNSATNPYRFPDAAIHYRTNHQHQLIPPRNHHSVSHNANRFYINQNGNEATGENLDGGKVIESLIPAGVINDPFSPESHFDSIQAVNTQRNKLIQLLSGSDKEPRNHDPGKTRFINFSYEDSNFCKKLLSCSLLPAERNLNCKTLITRFQSQSL